MATQKNILLSCRDWTRTLHKAVLVFFRLFRTTPKFLSQNSSRIVTSHRSVLEWLPIFVETSGSCMSFRDNNNCWNCGFLSLLQNQLQILSRKIVLVSSRDSSQRSRIESLALAWDNNNCWNSGFFSSLQNQRQILSLKIIFASSRVIAAFSNIISEWVLHEFLNNNFSLIIVEVAAFQLSSKPAPDSIAYSNRSLIVLSSGYSGSFSKFMHVLAVGRRSSIPALCTQNTGYRS